MRTNLIGAKTAKLRGREMIQERTMIKFTHPEVEALLRLLDDLREDEMTEHERSARIKLKKIYARQILSHEKREKEIENAKSNNFGLANPE